MTALERNEFIQTLVQNYTIEKYKNAVFQRENAEAYTYAKGELIGACMALGLDIEETKDVLTVITRVKKKIVAQAEIQK